MNVNLNGNLRKILNILKDNSLLSNVEDISSLFFDEPKFHVYTAIFNKLPPLFKNDDFVGPRHTILSSHGFSIKNAQTALMKCLMEGIERFSLSYYAKKNIIYSSINALNNQFLDPYLYYSSQKNVKLVFGWVNGINLTHNVPCFIPAQLIFLNYKNHGEPNLTTKISSGAAAGFSHEGTLLRGIYEIIERDCFITAFINKIKVPLLDLSLISDKTIRTTIAEINKYNLEIYAFEITNDLEIPTFMAIIIDRTGAGPAVSVGLKSSLDEKKALVGSIEEACSVGRSLMRYNFLKDKLVTKKISPSSIKTLLDRSAYWYPTSSIQKLDFLLKQSPKKKNLHSSTFSTREELKYIINSLSLKNHPLYFAEITPDIFKKIPLYVYKIVIPTLQPLYLDETQKELRSGRIDSVAHYFKMTENTLNPLPHPFL